MQRVFRLVLFLSLAAAPLHALGIYQCSYNAGAFTTAGCYGTTAFVSTNDFLDWGAPNPSGLGQALPSNHQNVPWTTNTNGGIGVGISQISNPNSSDVQRVDNLAVIPNGSGGWTNVGIPVTSFNGHFDALPDATTQYNSVATPYYGDHLIGFSSSNASILLTFTQPIYAVGFRISARSNSQTTIQTGTGAAVQDLTVQAFNTANPTIATLPFLSYELQDPDGFGTCSGLTPTGPRAPNPVPCNDAPYIGIDSTNSMFTSTPLQALPGSPWISSILISSTDPVGFYIDELFIQNAGVSTDTPEPATPLLIGSGLAIAALLFKKRRS
jgi:hypothetical protein